MELSQIVRRTEQLFGSRPAVVDAETNYDYRAYALRVRKLAGALAGLGIVPDDNVGVLALNSHRYLELYFGVPWAGAVIVPLNFRLAVPELVAQLAETEARVLCVDRQFAAAVGPLQEQLPQLRHIVFLGPEPPDASWLSYDRWVADAEVAPDAGRGGSDTAGIFYTGGTTGRSKGVMLTHDNLVANALNAITVAPDTDEDVYLHAAPMFHLADVCSIVPTVMQGAAHAFVPGFDPLAVLKSIERHRVTVVGLVPTMINAIVNHPQLAEHDLSTLRLVAYGASPIPLPLLERAMDVLPCGFMQAYGQTELSPLATLLWPSDHVRHPDERQARRFRSGGRAVMTAEVRVVDPQDQPLPTGEIGEVCARGPMVMKGYYKQPEATCTALRGGWMHTGDAGYFDDDGYLYLVDRTKDMIVTGGENVYSVEVEDVLYRHPAVLEAAVIGIPDDTWGEVVHAIVVLKPGHTALPEAIIEHCREWIAGYKCPKSLDVVTEPLPKTGPGKILKRALREPFWQGRERRVN